MAWVFLLLRHSVAIKANRPSTVEMVAMSLQILMMSITVTLSMHQKISVWYTF